MEVVLNIGSNLGRPHFNISNATQWVSKTIGEVVKVSEPYHSRPQGFESQNNFTNIALLANTSVPAEDLLSRILAFEAEMGRTRSSDASYIDRIIDIDIILYEAVQIDEKHLTLPHPRAHERDFVMFPLLEIHPYIKSSSLLQQANALFAQSKVMKNVL